MPPRTRADAFANDPAATLEQLQTACELLGLDAAGPAEALRLRLNRAPSGHAPEDEIACLHPDDQSQESSDHSILKSPGRSPAAGHEKKRRQSPPRV